MKKVFCFFIGVLILFSCQQSAIDKPDNLIDEDTMEEIIYDLALLEAIRTNNPTTLENKNITASTYVYDKYDIDSLQFVKSNHYYASDVHNYMKMYQRIEERLGKEKTKIDTILAQESKKIKKPKPIKPLKTTDSIKSAIRLKEKLEQKN
ncbi:hypothetical protein J2X31_000679 [Flavobacterium arsenatis]|uniref:DUF4296 domain-containing protein n=1 Tax=Flavobacterium arsenatis TaxID=1484332 RepID=A0ABU1TL52_9FLAO|nr:DUF4296 domain-containing protein [Flavobacterium arsenatis]MDR6966681.1 hypothetical protein [Flavobacterium arsenatis]